MSNIIAIIDNSIYSFIMNFQCDFLDYFMLFITNFASAFFLIGIAIICLILLKNKKNSNYIALNLVIVFILNRILKLIFARERPDEVIHMVTETGYSFPSGHTMIGTAFYAFIIYLIYKEMKDTKTKNILITILSVLTVLIAISRIYLGAHFATDVIGGVVFALVYLIVFIKFIVKRRKVK